MHVVAGILMYLAAFYFMRRFTTEHSFNQPDSIRGTLMVRNVPPSATEDSIRSHFYEAYGFAPLDVSITTDATKLIRCQETLVNCQTSLQFLVDEFDITKTRPMISTAYCGCGRRNVDGIAYYEELTRQAVAKHAELASRPEMNVGVFFATFTTDNVLHQAG